MKRIFTMIRRIFEINDRGGDIYIRCAGVVGQQLYYELKEVGIRVTAFLDEKTERYIADCDVGILSPDAIFEKSQGDYFVLIAIKDDASYEDICKEYKERGLREGIDFGDFSIDPDARMKSFIDIRPDFNFKRSFENIARERIRDMKTIDSEFNLELPNAYNIIPNLDVPLTTYCSMQCEFCSHCIPYANPPKHFSPESVAGALDKLLSVSFVTCLAIMGGEPFVYPKLTKFIELYARLNNLGNVGFTRIVTNGTILPKDDFFEAFSKIKNSYIYISNYGERSKKINELRRKCEDYGVKTYVCPYSDEWLVLGNVISKRNYNDMELRHLYAVCSSHSCIQLFNGHLYSCGRTPILNEDRIIPFSESDFCDVMENDSEELKEKLHKYLYDKPYLEGCRYCDGQHLYSKKVSRGE